MSIEHEMNLENLISLVQERQSIYDYKNKNYSNRNIREQLWTEISDILKVPGLYIFIILYYYFIYLYRYLYIYILVQKRQINTTVIVIVFNNYYLLIN